MRDSEALGTLLRHVLDTMEADVAAYYAARGHADYRPRYSPFLRHLSTAGPTSIRGLAESVGVTHSAASQTVAQMSRAGFVRLERGEDARQRMVHLASRTREMLPTIEADWTAVSAAVEKLNRELTAPLADVLIEVLEALERIPFGERIADAHAAVLRDDSTRPGSASTKRATGLPPDE